MEALYKPYLLLAVVICLLTFLCQLAACLFSHDDGEGLIEP
jgi:hypothetical protein